MRQYTEEELAVVQAMLEKDQKSLNGLAEAAGKLLVHLSECTDPVCRRTASIAALEVYGATMTVAAQIGLAEAVVRGGVIFQEGALERKLEEGRAAAQMTLARLMRKRDDEPPAAPAEN